MHTLLTKPFAGTLPTLLLCAGLLASTTRADADELLHGPCDSPPLIVGSSKASSNACLSVLYNGCQAELNVGSTYIAETAEIPLGQAIQGGEHFYVAVDGVVPADIEYLKNTFLRAMAEAAKYSVSTYPIVHSGTKEDWCQWIIGTTAREGATTMWDNASECARDVVPVYAKQPAKRSVFVTVAPDLGQLARRSPVITTWMEIGSSAITTSYQPDLSPSPLHLPGGCGSPPSEVSHSWYIKVELHPNGAFRVLTVVLPPLLNFHVIREPSHAH